MVSWSSALPAEKTSLTWKNTNDVVLPGPETESLTGVVEPVSWCGTGPGVTTVHVAWEKRSFHSGKEIGLRFCKNLLQIACLSSELKLRSSIHSWHQSVNATEPLNPDKEAQEE